MSSSLAGALNATTPLWTLVLTVALARDRRVPTGKVLGLVLGFTGSVVMLPWATGQDVSLGGAGACLGAALSYAVSYVYIGRYLAARGQSPLVLAASQLIAASAWVLLLTPIAGSPPVRLTGDVLAGALILGVLGTGAAYVLNYRIIADEGPTAASAVIYLLPVVSVVLGILALGEPLTLGLVLGGIAVLAGVAIVRRSTR